MTSISPLLQWWDFLWNSTGGGELLTYVAVAASIVAAILVSGVKSRFWPPERKGVHFREEAIHWAESRFPYAHLPLAAYVGNLLHEQLDVAFAQLEPGTNLVTDLRMKSSKRVEFVSALEDDLGISISKSEAEALGTVTGVVEYLAAKTEPLEVEPSLNPHRFVPSA